MNVPILSSTFFLTLMLLVGLVFFIRASVKDRTQQARFRARGSQDWLLQQLQDYFQGRAYQVASLDPERSQVVFQGFVRPSWFLAIFLTALAVLGLLCLALVLSLLYPASDSWPFLLTLLAPGAGIFYWQGAGRVERVWLQVEPPGTGGKEGEFLVVVRAHRDELGQLSTNLPFLREREEKP